MARRLTALALGLIVVMAAVDAFALGYRWELRRATKRGQLYSAETMEAKLLWRATLFTERFRNASVKKTIAIKYLEGTDAERYRSEQQYEQEGGWQFFIGFYTKQEYKQFSMGPDTFWKIEMITDDKVVEPLSIELVPIGPYEQIMFPYLNRWSKAYRVVFPKIPFGEFVKLRFYSMIGESTLTWRIAAKEQGEKRTNKYAQ